MVSNGGYKASVLALGVRVFVPYFPYTAAGNNTTVTQTQWPMLPKDVLMISSIPKLSVIISWLYNFSYHQHIISVISVNTQITIFQTIKIKMCQFADAVVRPLATAFPFSVCGHFPAVPTGAPWKSSVKVGLCCPMEEVHQKLIQDSGRRPGLLVLVASLHSCPEWVPK